MKRFAALFLAIAMVLSLGHITIWAEENTVEYKADAHYVAEDDLGLTNDELFEAYTQRVFDEAVGIETPGFYRTSALEEGTLEKEIYDALKVELAKVAAGTVTSTEITVSLTKAWSKADLGVTEFISGNALTEATGAAIDAKLKLVYTCLLADCPVELYWHDKTIGMATLPFSCGISGDNLLVTSITYQFAVAKDYSATGAAGTFATNINKTGAASAAVANAQAIVAANASKADLEKLTAYKDKICELVSYDTSAAASSPSVEGINPWQMIYVFDGDEDTNVVCEGYAKAFQFLCDLSFMSAECHTVSGTMSGGTGAGRHMWNVVTMDDGRNYLVDVTNCDSGTIGAPDKLFMAYTANSADAYQTHTFTVGSQNITFTYDETMKDLFCEGYLDLAATAYGQSSAVSVSLSGNSPVQAGTDVTLTLKVSGTNIMGVETTLDYDEDLLEFCSYNGLLSGWDVVLNGTKFVMYGVKNPINEASNVVSVTFRVKNGTAAGTQLNVAFKDIVVSDGNADRTVGTATWRGTVAPSPAPSPVAYIDGKSGVQYLTLQDAVDAADTGDVIKMLGDFELYRDELKTNEVIFENGEYVTYGKFITFDLDGQNFDIRRSTIDGDVAFKNGCLNVSDGSSIGDIRAKNCVVNITGGEVGGLLFLENTNCNISAGSFPALWNDAIKPYLVSETPFYQIDVTASPTVAGANWPIEVPPMFWLSVAVSGGASVVTNDGCFVECRPDVTATFIAESGNDEYYDCRISNVSYSGLASGDNLVTVSQENGATTFTMCPEETYSGVLPVGGNINVKYRAIPRAITAAVTENGSFSLPSNAIADELVTITTAPNNGYEVASIAITKTADGTDITDSVNLAGSPNTYTFVMPNGPVTVSVKYRLRDIPISEVTFPDANFRSYVADNFDTDGDGVLSVEERETVSLIDCNGLNISSLVGIEHFVALKYLHCQSNQLTSIDTSQNLFLKGINCSINPLTSLNVSNNPALVGLVCQDSQLVSLDVSNNPELESLSCDINRLTNLDVSNNPKLAYLSCFANQIAELDVTHNPELEGLSIENNQLTEIDVSCNPKLKDFRCDDNQLTALDVSHNPLLEYFTCTHNGLTSIDVSHNIALKRLDCHHNLLTSIDVTKNTALETLYIDNNQLKAIDVSKNSALVSLLCAGNSLTSIDVSNNPKLTYLFGEGNLYSILLDENKQFDLTTLPGSFDISKASNWENGAISGTILTATDTSLPVTYDYDCGNGYTACFTLYLETEISVTLGDANGDGTIDIGDHQRLFEHLQGIDVITDAAILAAVDVNKDGVVDIGDHQRLFEHLQGINPLK